MYAYASCARLYAYASYASLAQALTALPFFLYAGRIKKHLSKSTSGWTMVMLFQLIA
jgi:hypothetical protein